MYDEKFLGLQKVIDVILKPLETKLSEEEKNKHIFGANVLRSNVKITESQYNNFIDNLSNSFRWREIYTYGFIDTSDIGVDYPFLNGKHYPYSNYIFRVYPEGIGLQNINEITTPTVDECE